MGQKQQGKVTVTVTGMVQVAMECSTYFDMRLFAESYPLLRKTQTRP